MQFNLSMKFIKAVVYHFCMIYFLLGCISKIEQPITYRAYNTLYSEALPDSIELIIDRFRKQEPTRLQEVMRIDSVWNFQLGDTSEKLNEPYRTIDGIRINLPHQVELPDRAIWYSKEVEFSETGVLTISADDGAQLYVNGKRVFRLHDKFFPIDTIGILRITIRVLNNAMSGGLRRVNFSTKQQFIEYQKALDIQIRLNGLVQKISLINNPTQEQVELVKAAIENADESKIKLAEHAFSDFPYLTGPWLRIKDSTTWVVSVLSEGNFPVILKYGNEVDKLSKKLRGDGELISFEIPNVSGKKLHYQLLSGKTATPVYSFQKQGDLFSFNVWADSQSGWLAFRDNVNNSLRMNDAFGIGVGDLVSNGSDKEQWKTLFNELTSSSSKVPYYLIAGNHDYDGYYDNLNSNYYKEFTSQPVTYYSWTFNNCAFIALDPNEDFPIGIAEDSKQFNWFMKQLQSNEWKNATWHFVLLHQPPYSQGWPGYHGDQVVRDLLEPFIESAKIDFIVSGHTHNYERLLKNYGSQPVTFLIVGGGGGSIEPEQSSLYPKMDTVIKTHHWGRFYVEGESIRFEMRNVKNQVMDSFKSTKKQ
jgi:Icc-related predicted phosphoesterase